MTTIKKGTTGTDVKVLQALLRSMGFLGKNGKVLELDGSCGDNLVYAINSYQKMTEAYGVKLGNGDGSCGSKMWASLLGV